MLDTSALPFAKPRPHLLEKRDRKAAVDAEDRRQRKLCRLRSGGRCEVIVVTFTPEHSAITTRQCRGRAQHNHHLISGCGKRNIGPSILAAHRLDTCAVCHSEIENAVLVPVDFDKATDAATVRYERRS